MQLSTSFLAEEIPALKPCASVASRSLDAIVRMGARLYTGSGVALLVLENDRLSLAAGYNLAAGDRDVLAGALDYLTATALSRWAKETGLTVCPLLTDFAELLGAIVLFRSGEVNTAASSKELDEICGLATLAVEQAHLSEDLVYRAHHDPLTHLWNRSRMEEEIDTALTARGRQVGLVKLGLDRFRVINEVLGYHTGNDLLRQVALRIAENARTDWRVARSGGDEFMILRTGVQTQQQVTAGAQYLLDALAEPFQIGGHELVIRATAGCSMAAAGEATAGDLASWALTAIRHAKASSRGKVGTFEPSMMRVPPERLVMEQHLRFALQKREFVLNYQPQVEVNTGRVTGFEALLRWNHPSLGFISPGTFVPVAEELGLIEDIGDWVLDESLQQLRRWRASGLKDVRIAVNVSPNQFSRNNFAASVAQKLRRYDVEPGLVELEVTEGSVMSDFDHALRQLRTLRSLGVELAIDDFGTGHSSLAYLRTLPVHRLKVDRMFVKDIVQDGQPHPLLASITQMAHALDLSVITEGVETEVQLRAVREVGCEQIQGYYYSKPLPAAQVLAWVEQQHQKIQTPAA